MVTYSNKKNILLLFALNFVCLCSFAQQAPSVKAVFEPDTVLIGDRFSLKVTVEKDLAQVVEFPVLQSAQFGDTLEVQNIVALDTIFRDGRKLIVCQEYQMTCFEQGAYDIGRVPVMYVDKNVVDTLYAASSAAIVVNTFAIDTATMSIVDIKPLQQTPFTFKELLSYILSPTAFFIWMGLIVVVVAVFVVLKYRKRAKQEDKKDLEPPHVRAIRELEQIEAEKLWQNGKHKLYYTRLTDVVREYIEDRYGISAMEMTSQELMQALKSINLSDRDRKRLEMLLPLSDLVKFAKWNTSADENSDAYNCAYYFVEDTKEVEEPEVKTKAEQP